VEPQVYTGTSAGAYNAVLMAAQGSAPALAAVERLEEIWLRRIANSPETCGNGIYRVRGLPFQGLDPSCFQNPAETLAEWVGDGLFFVRYAFVRGANLLTSQAPLRSRVAELFDLAALFSARPFERLLAETLDLGALRASEKRLTVAASNWRDGLLRLFGKEEITDRFGAAAVEASAAIPGIFHPVMIEETPYVDGAVLLNTPLRPAIRLGADVLHVIYLDPLVEDIPFPQLPNTLDTLYRLYAISLAANMKNDILTAQEINAALGLGGEEGTAGGVESDRAMRVARRVVERARQGRPYRRLTIHRYRPTSDLGGGGGVLDFRQDFIEQVILLGYEDTVRHSCEGSQCLVLDRPMARHMLWSREERESIHGL
jgi:predicted acylesterase/phospholipase RssA